MFNSNISSLKNPLNVAIGTSIAVGAFLAFDVTPAAAFSFTTNKTGDDPKGNILLDSITVENNDGTSTLFDDFSFITRAGIVHNDEWDGGNSGAASADVGDNVNYDLSQGLDAEINQYGVKKENLSIDELHHNLNNLNLNSIIDTEDNGNFAIDLFFDKAVDNLLLWERGMNSKLGIQALDEGGNLIGNYLEVYSKHWDNAGFKINTQEIGGSQKVGARGISMSELGVENMFITGFRLTSKASYNGPDWKILGTDATRGGEVELPSQSVPEPGTMAGVLAIGGLLIARRRRSA